MFFWCVHCKNILGFGLGLGSRESIVILTNNTTVELPNKGRTIIIINPTVLSTVKCLQYIILELYYTYRASY